MLIEEFYKKDRELTKPELTNLTHKKASIPVDYFRKNLFNATTRESKELKKPKVIYDDGKNKILVNRSLHQRHRDLLSLLFTENKNIEISNIGDIKIYTSLYSLAKAMGYKDIRGSTEIIKGFFYDLRNTELTFKTKDQNVKYNEMGGHKIIGEYKLDTKTNDYIIIIPEQTNKFKILNYTVEISKELNRKIIAIPNNLAKIKALVSYMLSNQALKNGILFDNVCNKLDIQNENKSRFKKELLENIELLQEFNIIFNEETKIFKYEQIEDIKFHAPIKVEKLVGSLDQQMQQQEEPKKEEVKKSSFESLTLFSEEVIEEILSTNEERYKQFIKSYVNSPITINNIEYTFMGLNKNESDQILLEMKDKEEKTLRANTTLTTYYTVFNQFFKELV